MEWKDRIFWAAAVILSFFCVMGSGFFIWNYIRVADTKAADGNPDSRRIESVIKNTTDNVTEKVTDNATEKTAAAANGGIYRLPKDEKQMIDVCILDESEQNSYHNMLVLTSKSGMTMRMGAQVTEIAPMEAWDGSKLKAETESDGSYEMEFTPCDLEGEIEITSLQRADGVPAYMGSLYVRKDSNGFRVVNHLLLERYLEAVVSSEMPSDYPMEAQKAQAVCARTYALHCIKQEKSENSFSDLDDSVAFQVYNNYRASEKSTRAVRETTGEVLAVDDVRYYSTSCGRPDEHDLSEEPTFHAWINEAPDQKMEYGSPWIRWSTQIFKKDLQTRINACQNSEMQQIMDSSTIICSVQSRSTDGQVQELLFEYDGGNEWIIQGEYQIRQILCDANTEIRLYNGEIIREFELLPSAYFYLESETEESLLLHGGGYGHGVGMSQCGAAEMAASGADYRTILDYYYR